MINYTPSSHSEWKIYKCWFGVCQMHWRIIRAWGKNMIRCAKNYLGWTPRTLPDEHQALVFIKLTNAIPTVKHGYSIIMLKERFSPLGTRRLLKIKKNMNKPKHSNCSSFKRSYSCGFDTSLNILEWTGNPQNIYRKTLRWHPFFVMNHERFFQIKALLAANALDEGLECFCKERFLFLKWQFLKSMFSFAHCQFYILLMLRCQNVSKRRQKTGLKLVR